MSAEKKARLALPKDVYDFLSTMRITKKGIFKDNVLDREIPFVSRLYTPNNVVSKVSQHVLDDMDTGYLDYTTNKVDKNSLAYDVMYSEIKTVYPKLWGYLRVILLESVSYGYVLVERHEYLKYVNREDIKRIRDTIKWVLDCLGYDVQFKEIIFRLQDLDILFGYVEGQATLISKGVVK